MYESVFGEAQIPVIPHAVAHEDQVSFSGYRLHQLSAVQVAPESQPDCVGAGTVGAPKRLAVDNGPEFISKALDAWAYHNGVALEFSRPGKPTDNAFVESFNGHFRQECLDQHWFASLGEARQIIEEWRIEYNTERPHQALKYGTPTDFAAAWELPKEVAD
jgi:transposase InsO family protein